MIIFCTNINCLQIVHMAVDLVSWAGSDPCAMVYTSQIVMSLPPRVHSTEATLLLCSLCSSQITFSGYIDAYIDYCYWIGHVYALHNLVLICIQVLAYTTLCSPLSSLSLSLSLSHHYHLFKHPFHLVAGFHWDVTLLILTTNHQTKLPSLSATQLKTPWLCSQTISPQHVIRFRYKPFPYRR